MKPGNVKHLTAAVLCACLMSGCRITTTTPSSTTSSLDEAHPEQISSAAASEETVPDSQPGATTYTIQDPDLASYTEVLSAFFHSPMQSTKDILLDYYLSYFLLYQTFENNGAEEFYTQNENLFWEIPESDILQTAKECLGLSELSISDITEWPFGAPQDGVCYYTQETELPYSDVTVMEVNYSETAGEAAVLTEIRDSQFEDSSNQIIELVYHFTCADRADGTTAYCLQSITYPNE